MLMSDQDQHVVRQLVTSIVLLITYSSSVILHLTLNNWLVSNNWLPVISVWKREGNSIRFNLDQSE